MLSSGRRERSATRMRHGRKYTPAVHGLEPRMLLAIDLVNVAGNPPTGPGPFGVQEIGLQVAGGAGWSVAELGDVNGDGFDDFMIGAPTIDTGSALIPIVGNGAFPRAFLVFGSTGVNTGTVDFLTLTPSERIGDLSQLGNLLQSNPATGTTGFPFNGLTFVTNNTPSSQIGASVAGIGDVNNDGFADFMIGAPGATDGNLQNAGTGRAYLIYGGANLATRATKTVDLDDTLGSTSDLRILTFTNLNQPNGRVGWSVASAGDFILDGQTDIAIGAPNATVTGQANQGAVYIISGAQLRPARTDTIALNLVGQPSGVAGYTIAGETTGDSAGWSVAGVGNTTGRTTNIVGTISDLLVGSPDISFRGAITGPGSAYLIYANTAQVLDTYQVTSGGVQVIPLSAVGVTIPGAEFAGDNQGDLTGYAVSPAGDFNDDGLADFLIGSPLWNGPLGIDSGRANLVYGIAGNVPPGPLTGLIPLTTPPTGVSITQFNGPSISAWAGWSTSVIGLINNDLINEIGIGAPGVNLGQGQVYIIPGNPDLQGLAPLNLGNNEQLPIQGLTITNSVQGANLLGTSISGRLGVTRSNRTIDSDTIADVIVGAAGFSLNTARLEAGTGYALEGAFLPLPNVVSTTYRPQIRVNTTRQLAVYPVDITNLSMDIYVLSIRASGTTPAFSPVTDINPATVTVNGIGVPPLTSITVSPAGDLNGDGIPDARVTVTPQSALGLVLNTPQPLTIQGDTFSTAPGSGNFRFVGTATIRPTNTPPPPPVAQGVLAVRNDEPFIPPFGERLVPSVTLLYKATWSRMPVARATYQFLPEGYAQGRYKRYYHGGTPNVFRSGYDRDYAGHGTTPLPRSALTRSKFEFAGLFDARTLGR